MIEIMEPPMRTYGVPWAAAFLAALACHGSVKQACLDAGVTKAAVYSARRDHPEFATQWADARSEAAEDLVDEATRRAKDGIERPIYQGGKYMGTERVYSDRLMEVLLKGLLPKIFTDRHEHTGANGEPLFKAYVGVDTDRV